MSVVATTPKGKRTSVQILRAARRVFGRDGFNAARMSDVAAEAGISMGGLYRYFDNKRALFEAVIGQMHEQLYAASTARQVSFADDPYGALLEANFGYLSHYYEYRDVMRTWTEAGNIDAEFRAIWWEMRWRHIRRFVTVLNESRHVTELDGLDAELLAEAMACMVEQCAFVWFAHEAMDERNISVETAAQVVTRAWYRLFFTPSAEPATSVKDASEFLASLPRGTR